MGKLIVVEGVDASGKATQTERIYTRLKEEGYNVRQISFPDYDSVFCSLQKRWKVQKRRKNKGKRTTYKQ